MGFQVSPGVNVVEKDLTTIVPAVATTQAAFAGPFKWGPVEVRTNITSENDLVNTFWKPDNTYANSFFTCANYLAYSNNLQVVRVVNTSTALNSSSRALGELVKNETHWVGSVKSTTGSEFLAKYPGTLGDSLSVHVFDDAGIHRGGTAAVIYTAGPSGASGSTAQLATTNAINAGALGFTMQSGKTLGAPFAATGDKVVFWGSQNGGKVIVELKNGWATESQDNTQLITFKTPIRDTITAGSTFGVIKQYSDIFTQHPTSTEDVVAHGGTNDAMNIAVVDQDGEWTGTKGTVLEIFENVSKATDAKNSNGSGNFWKDVINEQSLYVWAGADMSGMTTSTTKQDTSFSEIASQWPGIAAGATLGSGGTSGVQTQAAVFELSAGQDGVPSFGDRYSKGYAEFEDAEAVDVSLVLSGDANSTLQRLLIDLCDTRKDCVAFISPTSGSTGADAASLVENKTPSQAVENVKNYRNNVLNKSSSYAVLDSGFKYQYDRYNDVYRYIPLNGDIAGLVARAEVEQDAWFSPAGFNRGQVKGVVKLGLNPKKAHRDDLYVDQINPVVSFPGEGVVLYGDKTLQSKPSAFDRINVRRLFIVLEKAIATASKFQLFEFNDEFTRSQFRNMVIPFLRDIQSRRGIFDFKVVCDESNNTGSVIDRNEFVADIYIKPARAINYITLNFIATPTGVDFNEVGG